MLITADQIRAARALKNWSQTDLAERTGLAVPTIANIELGKQVPGKNTIEKIIDAFTNGSIKFTENEGVEKMKSQVTAYRGREGYMEFIRSVDNMVKELGSDEFLVSHVDERDFYKWTEDTNPTDDEHVRLILSTNVKYKVMIVEGDEYMPAAAYAEYKWTPKELFSSVPFYVFGDKVAIIGFEKDDVNVFVLQDEFISKLYRKQFYEIWNRSKKIPKDLLSKKAKPDSKKGRK